MELQRFFGGRFVAQPEALKDRLGKVRAYLFDWDGVFNGGAKGVGSTSLFNEGDSMGVNLLRFGHWLQYGELPVVAIITGAYNESAFRFARREKLHACCFRFLEKTAALQFLSQRFDFQPGEAAFFFDDVLDLSVAQQVALRVLINREASPLMRDFVQRNFLADYITKHSGTENGVREACELILGLSERFDEAVAGRLAFDETYQAYWQARQAMETQFFRHLDGEIVSGDPEDQNSTR